MSVFAWLRIGERVVSLIERIFGSGTLAPEPDAAKPENELTFEVVTEQQRQQKAGARAFPPVTIEQPPQTPRPPTMPPSNRPERIMPHGPLPLRPPVPARRPAPPRPIIKPPVKRRP